MLFLLLKAFTAGIVYSAPLGPSAALAARGMLIGNTQKSLCIAFGAFAAEVCATLLTISGFRVVTGSLTVFHMYLGGGLLTLLIGLFVFFSPPPDPQHTTQQEKHNTPWTDTLSGFSITFFNPMSFVGLVILFASLGLYFDSDLCTKILLTAVLFCGCLTWWTTLLYTLYTLRKHLSKTFMKRLNQGVGTVLVLLAVYALTSAWRTLP